MTRKIRNLSSQKGFVLVYMAATLTTLLLFAGLAVDTGRAYVVKAQLTKAVDGAALAAARSLNSGNPRNEAERVFKTNFPLGYLGTTAVTDPATAVGFFGLATNTVTGVSTVTVTAAATVPTTFMRLANFTDLQVTSTGEATRRMVDLSLMLDVSSSIGSSWSSIASAATQFINGFDAAHDRFSLGTYGWGVEILDQMQGTRGFNKAAVLADVPTSLPGGTTPMAEGVYRAWDQLRTVSSAQQSSLRVIVLFTDGSGNNFPGNFDGSGISKGLFVNDFPAAGGTTSNTPQLAALYDSQSGNQGPSQSITVTNPLTSTQTLTTVAPYLPLGALSFHSYHQSTGIPTSFPLQSNMLTVNGSPQTTARPLTLFNSTVNKYPATAHNVRNAATNLTEVIANAARADSSGAYPIRIYTLGMGALVTANLGTIPETSESVLKRIANDKTSPDFNSAQLEGKYFFAPTPDDVAAAFQSIQNQILRLSK
jgi:Flp pilus assembly protein TadG